MKCPYCHSIIDDDSRFCDTCGKALYFCPECREPRAGTSCPRCGEVLVAAAAFYAVAGAGVAPAAGPGNGGTGTGEARAVQSPDRRPQLVLKGSGMTLDVREGSFGRTGGIFPELSSCSFVSGNHGSIKFSDGDKEWMIADRGSTNGTFIDGKRLESGKWYFLQAGTVLKIATLSFNVEKV